MVQTTHPRCIVGEELNSQRPELVGLDPLAAVVAPGLAAHLVV